MKHATTMLDELSTATTAHGPQLRPTKIPIISNTASKRGRGNTVTVQRMNIEILPSERETKHLGQLIFFNNAVQVELEQSGQHSWALQQELKSSKVPTEGHTQTLRRQFGPHHTSTHQERGRWRKNWRRCSRQRNDGWWGWSHRQKEQQIKFTQLRMQRAPTTPPTSNTTTPRTNRSTTRLSTTTKTSTSRQEYNPENELEPWSTT